MYIYSPMKTTYILAFFMILGNATIANTELSTFVKKFEATSFVNDFAGLLNFQQKDKLNQKINAINDSTSIQFAICTVKSLEGYSVNDFAKALGNFWGVGHQQLNNGVLIVSTVAEREIYIALGDGTEKYIEENYLKILIKEVMKPAFVKGNYADGFNNAVEKIYMKLRGSGIDMRAVKAAEKNNIIFYAIGALFLLGMMLLYYKMKS